jgi:small subunit ribosomal protein S7
MRRKVPKRKLNPDTKYHSIEISKLINHIMRQGKKTTAQGVVYECLDIIKEKSAKNPLEVYATALKNVAPDVEVKSRRVGGGNFQVPITVTGDRKLALAHRWILNAARTRKGAKMALKLAEELMSAANKEGAAIKKREDVYRMAEANRAFAHFAR